MSTEPNQAKIVYAIAFRKGNTVILTAVAEVVSILLTQQPAESVTN